MSPKTIISLVFTCLVFTCPMFSMNSNDNDSKKDTYTVPIVITGGTCPFQRSYTSPPIEAYYHSGYVSFVFYEINESVLITISNVSTGESVYFMRDESDNYMSINIDEILSNGMFEVLIMAESGETYIGLFIL